MSGKRAKHDHEEHMDESWLVPYADVLTLLLALFIVLFATSKVDKQKFEEVAESFKSAFSGGAGILPGGIAPVAVQSSSSTADSNANNEAYKKEEDELAELQKNLNKFIKNNNLENELSTDLTPEGLKLLIKDQILFKQGDAEVLPSAIPLSKVIADVLGRVTQDVVISGHTDDVPINNSKFDSNWDLSSQRALNFMKYLFKDNPNLNPQHYSAVGFSEYKPIVPNITAADRAMNRRIEVLIKRSHPLK